MEDLLVVLLHAHCGRLEVRQKHWTRAIANRQDVLAELTALKVAPELQRSRKLLIPAMRTSLASDRAHDAHCRCPAQLDHRATTQKRAFIRAFHRYFTGHIAHTDI